MATLGSNDRSKTADNAIDARLKADAARQGRAIDTALNAFSGHDREAQKRDDCQFSSSSGRSASLLSGLPGGAAIGMNEGPRPAAKADDPLADLHPNARNLPVSDNAKRLASIMIARSAQLPFGEPIQLGASAVAKELEIGHKEADAAVNELRSLDIIVARYNGSLGILEGFVLDASVRG